MSKPSNGAASATPGSIHSSSSSRGKITGIRLCTGSMRALGPVVMMEQLRSHWPSGAFHTLHSPAKAKRSPDLSTKRSGMRRGPLAKPLVEAVGQDQAAPLVEDGAETRLLQGVVAQVDHAVAHGDVFRPPGHQPPAHQLGAALALVRDDEHLLSRRDVVLGGNVHPLRGNPESLLDSLLVGYQRISAAHDETF